MLLLIAYKTLGNRNRKEPRRDCKLNDGGVTENKKNQTNQIYVLSISIKLVQYTLICTVG